MSQWPRHLPWIDAAAGFTVGLAMFLVRDFLVGFYGLSIELLTVIASANVGYSLFGLGLGLSRQRPAPLLYWLICANFMWSVVCVVLAARVWSSATVFGLAHILAEGLFVAGLAFVELRHRRLILERAPIGSAALR